MVHSLGKGIVVLETQQSSDTTYRLYDFDRVDKTTGQRRELHKKQAIDTITVPAQYPDLTPTVSKQGDATVTKFIKSPFFSVQKLELTGKASFKGNISFKLLSVISGSGSLTVDGKKYPLEKGVHFILPNNVKKWALNGDGLMIIQSNPENLK